MMNLTRPSQQAHRRKHAQYKLRLQNTSSCIRSVAAKVGNSGGIDSSCPVKLKMCGLKPPKQLQKVETSVESVLAVRSNINRQIIESTYQKLIDSTSSNFDSI
jgi:hypothetical protein